MSWLITYASVYNYMLNSKKGYIRKEHERLSTFILRHQLE